MKQAALYARVSSDIQKKEKTIESQIDALKKQIAVAGHVLVKEYVDDGWSGARLDRPALDKLRADLKTEAFEVIYFLNTDRIARDVTYQHIIISELLKAKKQIIINGKDYVENPENKFTLTVLGAVSELERAKIIERAERGKQARLAQGFLLGGANLFGYDYVRRTPTTPPVLIINETAAAVIRFVFNEYATQPGSLNQVCRKLEDMGARTKNGGSLWTYANLRRTLRNPAYAGTIYFNATKSIREHADPLFGTPSSHKRIRRDRKDWIGIPIPPIVSRDLFDKVQDRLDVNRKQYRNPKTPQLLSTLIGCGHCGASFFSSRRVESREGQNGRVPNISVVYKCSRSILQRSHSKNSVIQKCGSGQRNAPILEQQVFALIESTLFDPEKLSGAMEFFKQDTAAAYDAMKKELERIEESIRIREESKRRITDVYVTGDLSRDAYVKRCRGYDHDITELQKRHTDILKRVPLLQKTRIVDTSIRRYCAEAKVRYQQSDDFASKRQFLVDYVKRIIYWNDKIEILGTVPITMRSERGDLETSRLEFRLVALARSRKWRKYLGLPNSHDARKKSKTSVTPDRSNSEQRLAASVLR